MSFVLFRNVCRDRRGISATEFALIAPVFLTFLSSIVQFGTGYFVKNHMQDVARDTTRQVAIGAILAADAEQYALDHLINLKANFSVDVIPPSANNETVKTVISVPSADLALFDFLGLFDEGNVEVSVSMMSE